jgi:predicted RNA binding protein YcfA (HicA-like mRNA interferase family)
VPSPERFAVVRRILEDKGYTLSRITGSHHIFTKPGQPHLSVPVHGGKVKAHYVREAKKAQ